MSAVLSGLVSLLFRFLVFTYLRIIPARQGLTCYGLFGLYFILWFYEDRKLKLIEESTQRTLDKQVLKTEERLKKGHPLKPKQISADSTKPNNPSYSQVVKNEKKPVKEASPNDPSSKFTTVDPPIELEFRNVNVPGRPGIFSLLFGATSQSRAANRFNLLVNGLLFLSCLDFQFSPLFLDQQTDLAFIRVGGVGDTWANLIARIPPIKLPYNNSTEELLGAKVLYRLTQPVGAWQSGPIIEVTDETDYTGTVQLTDLYPSTQYEYRLVLPSSSSTTHHPHFKYSQRFSTWQDPRLAAIKNGAGTHFKFASTACMIPYWPYTPFRMGKSRLRMKGVDHLASGIKQKGIEFLLFLGDFIYVDVPFYTGAKTQSYLRKYRQAYASDSYRRIYEQIPTLHIYDDHEIYNDYSEQNSTAPLFKSANEAWRLYQGSANPSTTSLELEPVNYYWFRNGDAAFFVWDTRKYRSHNTLKDGPEKTMLGEIQKQVFKDWLATVNQTVTWKFVVSSVPVMTLWDSGVASAGDTFASFKHERQELLDVMEHVPNIIILSGDRHEFAAASLRHTVLEFSTSPLHQFYLPIRTLSQSHGLGATGEDLLLKYLPDGNSKYTTFEVDTRIQNQPVLKVEVIIDGKEAWKVEIKGRPVHSPPIQVGRLAPSLAELFGFLKRRWF